jgi:hypothetical protein
MLKENLKDAGEIIQTIITQPLSIPGATENVTLLSAAENYDKDPNDLTKILQAFLDYPEPTHTLLTELELLAKDLHVS